MSSTALSLPPLSLYIHIPWCLKKCPYCDFNSHAFSGELPEQAYVDCLLEDLATDLEFVQGRSLASIFIGGGTPSLFSPASIGRLLAEVESRVGFADDIEITMEANPGTFELEKFSGFRAAGINRLSIGIQSFQPQFLQALGRVHGPDESRLAAAGARAAGFDNFNLDLMFGLPGQDTDQALSDIQTTLEAEPPHLSWYQLTIEPNTVFYSKPPPLPNDDNIIDLQDAGVELLAEHGLSRYEVSAFSQPGRQARHNLNYWLFGDYLGIGAGAHGKLTLPGKNRIIRTRKVHQPATYLDGATNYLAQQQAVKTEELALEFMMNALRLREGCGEGLFEQRTGLPLTAIAPQLQELRDNGLIESGCLATTAKGFAFLNEVLGKFLPDDEGDSDLIPLHAH